MTDYSNRQLSKKLEIPHLSRGEGFVRNDNINWCSVMGKQWRFTWRIATASTMPHKILSFRALARNLIISCFEFVIDNRYSNNTNLLFSGNGLGILSGKNFFKVYWQWNK